MSIKIALAGNPNCGKTTMFNDLTGSSQYVGNWPGVTVEKKEGKLKGHKEVTITDLPGIYSLSPYTLEEVVSRNYLLHDKPEAIINLVDGTNLERNLYLTTQILELGIPVVVALNMIDLVKKNGDVINTQKLSAALGCEVVETSALKGTGSMAAAEKAIALAGSKSAALSRHKFGSRVEKALEEIAGLTEHMVPSERSRWYSIKLFERDEKVQSDLPLDAEAKGRIEAIICAAEKELDDDSESIITNERYTYIANLVKTCVHKKRSGMTTSDKIDRIVTNRFLALPIFAAVMFIVYYISVSWLGTIVTDWTNDTLFGSWIQPGVSTFLENVGAQPWLNGLLVDGIIGGVGAVLGFVPQMFILFFFLSILEDCGYMARVAFIMDRIFRKFGLSGKSFIPMLISSGCGVPGIMATKTIENEKDRRMTIMTTTFIPCGAKLPVIALIGGAMFPNIKWMAPAMYFLGIAAVIFSGIILKKTKMFSGDPAPFVMELPQYHVPAPKGVLIHMWERGKAFIIKAGTVIFVACGVIWFLSNFGFAGGNFGMVEEGESMLAAAGSFIAPIFAPLGFGNWQAAVATVSGLVAKENVVGTFGVLFGLGADVTESDPGLLAQITAMFPYGAAALSFLVFNLLCAPCFAAIGAIKREMASSKWTFFAIGYQTLLAYVSALMINQIGGLIFGGLSFSAATVIAFICLAVMVFLLFRPAYKGSGQTSAAGAAA
ncbi:ferrous iron transport protein B [Anaerolentibacter hominis]|uniref:ferrous iron transport protein B n=1 Tax=Anaerolentibacter hominis TaxID=3079009 RepID=UPI0031B802B1